MSSQELFVQYGSDGFRIIQDLLTTMQLGNRLRKGMKVIIKPNLVLAKPSESGATTDPRIVAGIIEFLQRQGIKDIAIMESSWVGDSTTRAFKVCGYQELEKRYGVELRCLKNDTQKVVHSNGLDLLVCASVLDCDFLINVPVLKAHCQTKLTCALKNLKGCIPDQEKRRFHRLGLHKPIAALNAVIPQHLIVVDGIIGDLTFEEGGTPVQMNRVICGTDPVAVDTYCAELLGYNADDIPYISLAEQFGVGKPYARIIEQNHGEEELAILQKQGAASIKGSVLEKQACSACVASLTHALQRLDEQGVQISAPLAIGQGFKGKEGPYVGIGNCTCNFKRFVQGCPASAHAIISELRRDM